ncbi:unannotated protein [freshwater metagenome]|uniref:Unannotated protein n=1 Tax=freshwater metagenome TaxID=449393 RepID=A0A6J6EUW7_9ZZZZ
MTTSGTIAPRNGPVISYVMPAAFPVAPMASRAAKPGMTSVRSRVLGPRCDEKYRRSRFGLNTGPVISDNSCPAPTTRTNGATAPSGVMMHSSMLPPSSATIRSPEPASTVMLSTCDNTAPSVPKPSGSPFHTSVYFCASMSISCTE